VNVLNLKYGQTPESVADFAAYAKDKAAGITLVKRTIPLTIGILGALALAAAAVMAAGDRRRPPAAAATPPVEQRPAAYV
jgi:hypothetical protein